MRGLPLAGEGMRHRRQQLASAAVVGWSVVVFFVERKRRKESWGLARNSFSRVFRGRLPGYNKFYIIKDKDLWETATSLHLLL
jgi:hypothetical protein